MLILEGIRFISTCLARSHLSSNWLSLWRWFDFRYQGISSSRLRRRLWCALHWLFRSRLLSFSSVLTLATISSACSPCSTNCFQVRHSATFIWVSRKVCRLWRHVSTSVDWVMPLGQWSAMLWNPSTKVLIDSLFFCLTARRVGTEISVSFSKK